MKRSPPKKPVEIRRANWDLLVCDKSREITKKEAHAASEKQSRQSEKKAQGNRKTIVDVEADYQKADTSDINNPLMFRTLGTEKISEPEMQRASA